MGNREKVGYSVLPTLFALPSFFNFNVRHATGIDSQEVCHEGLPCSGVGVEHFLAGMCRTVQHSQRCATPTNSETGGTVMEVSLPPSVVFLTLMTGSVVHAQHRPAVKRVEQRACSTPLP